jgi:hypothetical protein
MLVRTGVVASDSMQAGQRVARTRPRATRALPGGERSAGSYNEPSYSETRYSEPGYAREEASTRPDARISQRALEAYRAADLVQPWPGMYLRVRA